LPRPARGELDARSSEPARRLRERLRCCSLSGRTGAIVKDPAAAIHVRLGKRELDPEVE